MMAKKKKQANSRPHTGYWVMLVAAVMLETITCLQYFSSRIAIRHGAEMYAKTELRKAELEIEKHTTEMETAAKALALLAERHVDCPDSIYTATQLAVRTISSNTSVAVAYLPDYFPQCGRYFEVCSSRISEDSIHTRNIGNAEHDYTTMEWWQNGFVHDSCWWCEPYMDDSGSEGMVVSCSYPVRDRQGQIVAVVCVDLALDYLQELSEALKIFNSYSSIRSGTGQNIVSAPDTVPGRKYNIYGEDIDATGWRLEIIIPEEELFADLNRIGRWIGIMMLVGLIMLALLLIYSARMTNKLIQFAEENKRMEGELEVAQTIQMAMLPKVFPPFLDRLDLNIYGMVDPAKEVGGDLYDFYVRHDKLFFCVGDVSGKGVPAALVMATARSLFRGISAREEEAATIVSQMNNALSEQNEQNMFLTLFLGVLDLTTGELNYCNAGHNAPILLSDSQWKAGDVLPNLPLGIMKHFAYESQTVQLQYNDVVFLYTDGLTEAEDKQHNQYGETRMMEALNAHKDCRPREVVEALQAGVMEFVNGAEQSDDLTMLAIRYQRPAILMRNDIQQIPTLAEWVDGLNIPMELNMPVNLALEEAVSNVMLYAYPGRNDGKVYVEFSDIQEEGCRKLIFTISDSGVPFDPTKKGEADITSSAEERAIGGLGIHLVRQLMDNIYYERKEEKNILTLVKEIHETL